jgi:hypothetical protein
MKKIVVPIVVCFPLLLLSGCATEVVTYEPAYTSNYVYSVGYSNYRPYWGNSYIYTSTGCGNVGYWGTSTYWPLGYCGVYRTRNYYNWWY